MSPSEHESSATLYGLDDESRQMVLDVVPKIKARLLTRENILEFDRKEIFPEEIIRTLLGPDIGLQLLFIPEAYGGMSGGARDCCALTREMAGVCLGVATAFFAIQLGADPLIVGGTDAQKEKWLGAIAEGRSLVAYAVTEPGAGSNLAALKTKADPICDDSGAVTGYRINGSKQFISTGGYADFITLLAVTPEGPSFFVVEKGTPGFVQGKGEEKHGIRASNTSPLTFTDVVVPVEHLVGGVPGQGLKQANSVFGYTRLMVAAMALGAGEAALSIAIPYARDRIQFGSPLSEKQGYTHKLIVPHIVRFEAASSYLDEVALRIDAGDTDLQVEGAIAKLFASETANRAADDAIQALGGYGYITEFGVEKIKRDVRITCIYEGTSEILQNIIGMFRWKKTWKSKGVFYRSIAEEMAALHQKNDQAGCLYYGLAAEALNRTVLLAHEKRLTRSQHVMFCLADMMTHVEIGASLARKATALGVSSDPQTQKVQAASRIFAAEVAQLVYQNMLKILLGNGLFSAETFSAFLESISCQQLPFACADTVQDMDRICELVFDTKK
jgi:alkylation response protein AidB-like acyl-CoA dehydrogenase